MNNKLNGADSFPALTLLTLVDGSELRLPAS